MADNSIFEPRKLYESEFKEKFKENASTYFDELVEKSGVDKENNKALVKKYKDLLTKKEQANKSASKTRSLKVLYIVLSIILIILGLMFIAIFTFNIGLRIALGIISILLGIMFIVFAVKLNKKIKQQSEELAKLDSNIKSALYDCYKSMSALNDLYDWTICQDLVEKTTPLIDLDPYFDPNKFEYMHEKYGFRDSVDKNQSTNYVLSGNINGNPFLVLNTFNTKMVDKTYSNSIVIHWTTTSRDANGKTVTRTHSQTLTASVTKPAPTYFYDTRLVYTNDGAGHLEFSRLPSVEANLSDKDIDKLIKKGESKLQKMTENAVKEGKTFNAMANTKFEIMFNALNRNNETEFRLMFTPLAQQSMTDLLLHSPYGDDFAFYKDKYINYIFSAHSQKQSYKIDPSVFVDYDLENAKQKFIVITCDFFKGLYFDLSPLLAVPLYQQTKTNEYIYEIPYEAYNSKYEQETLANKLDKSLLKHPQSSTDAIIKCDFESKDDDTDYITLTAYSYKSVEHTDIQTKLGGDGRMHQIPVRWYEYVPLEKKSRMAMSKVDTTRNKFNNSNELINKLASQKQLVFERGLLSYLITNQNSSMKDIKDKIKK